MPTDYFTVSEFREITADRTSPYEYDEDDIARAQEQVIDHLERWAYSAWPNVTSIGSGGITAATNDLSSASSIFATSMVGSVIRIVGAGTDGDDLVSTIATFVDGQNVTLDDDAVTTVTTAAVYVEATGRAASPRSRTDQFYEVHWPQLTTDCIPVIAVDSVLLPDGDTVTSYTLDPEIGLITWGSTTIDWGDTTWHPGVTRITATYSYGFTACPWAVKRLCIKAAESLLTDEESRSALPPGVTQYSTGSTTVLLQARTDLTAPWPWDWQASQAMVSYWADRPKRFVSV